MNRPPDVELVLRAYLADSGDRAPDRVLEDVAARIARQPRSAWRLRGRPFMNTYTRMGLAAAAVLLVAVVGYSLLPKQGGPGGQSSAPPTAMPTANPTAAPTSSSSAGAMFPEWFTPESGSGGAGVVPAGSVTTRAFLKGSKLTVPDGWVNEVDTAEYFGVFPDTPANEAEFARNKNLAQVIFMGIVDTPALGICGQVGDTHGSTAAELVDSLLKGEGLVTSNAVDVTIGGLTGMRVDAYLDPAWTASCTAGSDAPPTSEQKDHRGRYVFLDLPTGAKLLIIVESVQAADFDAFLANAMPIVESLQFNVGT